MHIAFSTLYSYLLLSFFLLRICEMLFVLVWKNVKYTTRNGLKRVLSGRNPTLCVSHLQCNSIFSWRMITWHRIKNQQLQEKGYAAPTRPSSLVAELENTYLQWVQKSALNLATLPCCVTYSDCAWQILKCVWWHLESTVDSANMPSNQSVHDKLWNTYCENYGPCHSANLLLKTYCC